MQKLTLAIVVGSVMTYSSIAAPPHPAVEPLCTIDEQADSDPAAAYPTRAWAADPDSEEEEHKVRIRRRLY